MASIYLKRLPQRITETGILLILHHALGGTEEFKMSTF
jgi:hypothetical protein